MSVSKPLLRAMEDRDGRVCAWHGPQCGTDTLVPHHRSNRGMGGSKAKNALSNLVWLCSEVNGLIESNAEWADRARNLGIKISIHATPNTVLIDHAVHGACWLGDDGTVVTQEQAIREVAF